MRNNNQTDILLISSASLTTGPGAIAMNIYNTLCDEGCNVDVLTLYEEPKFPKAKYIYKKKSRFNAIAFNLRRKFWKKPKDGYYFFYHKESIPPVSTEQVLKQVDKDYDAVIIYFWQNLLSFKTVEMLYDKLKCKFVFVCADYSPMSGGCHFTNECKRFMTGCGCCPAFDSTDPNDFTHWNVMYRKKVYEKVKPAIIANHYMVEYFFKKSYLLKDCKFFLSKNSIDHKVFKPIEKEVTYKKFQIPEEKKKIISFGCQSLSDERKGMSYLLDTLDMVYEQMTDEERKETMLMFIGNNGDKIIPRLKFDHKDLGYIPISDLPAFYSISTLFVCSSVNDAGPSMVSQSLACGTPVVSFKMGSALELVLGRGTGYCAELRDSADLAAGVLKILRMDSEEYQKLRTHCIDFSRKECSRKASGQLMLSAIQS